MDKKKISKNRGSGFIIIILVSAIIAMLFIGVPRNTQDKDRVKSPSRLEQNIDALESAQEIQNVLNDHNQDILLEY